MTSQQTAQARQGGANAAGYQSDVPMQIRFPVRSRKAPAELALGLPTSREDVYLAPAHKAVLSLTSLVDRDKTDHAIDPPDIEGPGPEGFISNVNRAFKLPLTITAVSGHPTENRHDAQCAVSSAGTALGAVGQCNSSAFSLHLPIAFMHALHAGSNAELEAAESNAEPAPVASALLQGAQALLVQQQQQEESAQAAVFAANAALQEAQVSMSLHFMRVHFVIAEHTSDNSIAPNALRHNDMCNYLYALPCTISVTTQPSHLAPCTTQK